MKSKAPPLLHWILIFQVAIAFLSVDLSFAVQFNFTPRLSVSGEYTDNVFLQSNDRQDDFITGISPSLTAQLKERTYGFNLSYDPEYVSYAQTTENNTWRHTGNFTGFVDITKRTRLEIRDSLTKTEDPFSYTDIALIRNQDPGQIIDPTIRLTRNSYLRNSSSTRLSHQFGEKDSAYLNYNYSILRNEDPTIIDNDVHTPSGGFTYWFTPNWGMAGDFSYQIADYENSYNSKRFLGKINLNRSITKNLQGYLRYSHSDVQYQGTNEDDRTYNPSLGVDYKYADDISLALDVGYFINDFDLRSDKSGWTVDGQMFKQFQKGNLNLSARSGYDYSIGQADDIGFQLYYEGGASGTYFITKHISSSIFGSYRYTEYPDQSPARTDETSAAGAGFNFQLLKWLTASFNYTYRFVDSNIGTNYTENRAMIRVTVLPSTPFRWD